MTGRVKRQWSTTAATIAGFVAIWLASYMAPASPAGAETKDGEVVAEFEGVRATFSGGDPEFSVTYDIQIIALPDGTTTAIFNQRSSDDVLRGEINENGIPPVLKNPGKEKMTGGRMKNDRTLTYGYYEYVSGGQTYTWSNVVFQLPSGALPFPAPSTVEEEEEGTATAPPEEEQEQEPAAPAAQAPAEDEGGIPTVLMVAVAAGGVAALGGGTLAYVRRKRKGGCDEEYARWQAAEHLYDEAIKAESDAGHEKEMQQIALDRAVRERQAGQNDVLGKHVEDPSAYTRAMEEWEAKAPEYNARVEQEQAKLDAAKAAHDAATQHRKELDARRQEAKSIYEACTGQAVAAASTTTVAGPVVATAPSPLGATQTRGFRDETPQESRELSRSSVSTGKPWEGMDWRDEGTQEWQDSLTDQEYDEWQEWREQARSKEIDSAYEAPPAMTDEEYERYVREQLGEESSPPDLTGPVVRIVDANGNPLSRVVNDQPFHVEVRVPRIPGESPRETIEVTIQTPAGNNTLTIRFGGTAQGPAVYRSEPIMTKPGGGGAEGGGALDIGPFEFSTGGIGGFDLRDGDTFEVSFDGATAVTRVFTSWALLGIDAMSQAIGEADAYYRNLILNLRGAERELAKAPDSEEKAELLDTINSLRVDAENRLGIATRGRMAINSQTVTPWGTIQTMDLLDTQRLEVAQAYVSMLGLTRTAVQVTTGETPPPDLMISWDRREEADLVHKAIEGGRDKSEQIMWSGLAQGTIAGYRLLAAATLASQTLILLTGKNEMGQTVGTSDRILAFVDLLSQACLMGAMVKWNVDTMLPTRDPAVGGTRIDRLYVRLDSPTGTDKPLKGAAPGQLVGDAADIGMLPGQGKKFQMIIDRFSKPVNEGGFGRPIVAVQRPAGRGGVERLAEGAAGKPEPIKAKSISQTDVEGGWAQAGTENTIGYFTPDKLGDALGVSPDSFAVRVPDPENPGQMKWQDQPAPPGVKKEVWDRAIQRFKEYHDEMPMMNEILGRGLAEIQPNGQIIDRGITNYRLDPDTHELVDARWGTPGGTGKPIGPDPDPYIFVGKNTKGEWELLSPAEEAALTTALHEAGVMHGPVFHWDPSAAKDILIRLNVLKGHDRLKIAPTGEAVINPAGEALVIFGGRGVPRLTTYGDYGLTPLTDLGGVRVSPGARGLPGGVNLPFVDVRPWFAVASTQELLDGTAPSGPGWEWTGQYHWDEVLQQWIADEDALQRELQQGLPTEQGLQIEPPS